MTSPQDKLDAIFVANWQKRIAKIDPTLRATEAERKAFYRRVLEVEWLSLEIKDFVLAKGLGISVRTQNAYALERWAIQTAFNIALRARRMEETGEGQGPRGGVIDRAWAAEAEAQRMTVDALEKRLKGRRKGREPLGAERLCSSFLDDLRKADRRKK